MSISGAYRLNVAANAPGIDSNYTVDEKMKKAVNAC